MTVAEGNRVISNGKKKSERSRRERVPRTTDGKKKIKKNNRNIKKPVRK